MSLMIRVLLLALTAILVSACAASSVSETVGEKLPPRILSAQPAVQPSKEAASEPDAARDQEAVRKVALTVASLSDPSSKSYKIGPRDTLEVTVFQEPELTKSIQVSEVGTINFPLIGELEVAGMSARDIEQDLKKKLGPRFIRNPQVSVFVKDHFSQRITLEGAFSRPGLYHVEGGKSLLQVVAEFGGFADNASKEVLLFRKVDGKRLAGKFDFLAIREGTAEDPQLEAGDVLIAPTSDIKDGLNWFSRLLPLAMLAPYL